MRASDTDTIVAIATPPGYGGIGIVRLSGDDLSRYIKALVGAALQHGRAHFTSFFDANGEVIDEGVALYFDAPHSFTGQQVLECHCHGSPVVLQEVINTAVALGARIAEPGEFTKRRYLSGKIDLAQAEAIADMIHAQSASAARSAVNTLRGDFSAKIYALSELILQLRIYVEAALDFPEEEIDFLSEGGVASRLSALSEQVEAILALTAQGVRLQEGITVTLSGPANAGKSSLMNVLTQEQTAIVTDIPGTTRDWIKASITIDGFPVHLTDTAGLRQTLDVVEKEGVNRALQSTQKSDLVVWVFDETQDDFSCALGFIEQWGQALPDNMQQIIVLNKADQTAQSAGVVSEGPIPVIRLSAKTHEGMDILKSKILSVLSVQPQEAVFIARKRHLIALHATQASLSEASNVMHAASGELVAEHLKEAHTALGQIVGEMTSDDLLGEIFSSFCIGK